MKKIAFLAVAGLALMGLAGCPSNSETPPATTTVAPKPATQPGAPQKPSSQMSTDDAPPPGTKTDLSGGLNGPKPK
ncbi:MAG: hypothetical protein QM758_19005 [Armatimonas sp.]